MNAWQVVSFLACVGVATCAQSLTGFAFGLILLGLVGVLHLAPLADAANVASVLTLVQAAVVLKGSRKAIDLPTLRDTALGSGIGVVGGVVLLGWLSGNVVLLLRVLLGLTILACATVLVARSAPLPQRSSRGSFRAFGLASGLMSGLFSSAGPPLVYQFYRQPMNALAVRQTLVMVFAFNALLRLMLTVPTGQFSLHAVGLSLLALPMVLGLTWLMKRHPPDWSPRTVRGVVCGLLVLAGLSLVVPVAASYAHGGI
ncbi:TSUP family transporter [Variovorax sp. J22R133]|uniref:TSUP family transporter n=1 Tax=Variovorax brevis TaxID=3053503 RepID=UPI002577B0B3|nr:TSUP family transporter [Variovorax sp. J22R133]MDM0111596.1 TSUP family transporter [Variovorax sp. J22R133]